MESLFPVPAAELIFSTLFRTASATNLARVATQYGMKLAAEVKTSFDFSLNWQAEPDVTYRQVITPGQQLFFLYCESILLALIYYQRNPLSLLWYYVLQDFGESNNTVQVLSNGMVEFTHAIPDPTCIFQAHGPVEFASEGPKGESMIYADGVPQPGTPPAGFQPTTWSFQLVNAYPSGTPPATCGLIVLGRYNNGEPTADNSGFLDSTGAPITGGGVPISTSAPTTWIQTISDDVFLTVIEDGVTQTPPAWLAGGVSKLSVKGRCSVWSHFPPQEVWNSITNYANGETQFVANNLTLWNPNKAVPMSAEYLALVLQNPTDDVNIMRYCLGGEATQFASTLGPSSSRKPGTWNHGLHTACLPADTSWANWSEVLSAASNNAATGIYDAKYRRSGQGLGGVQRSQVRCIILTVQGITNATVLEGMTVHGLVASAWMYTSSKQSADSRMPTIFPDVWERVMAFAQGTYPVVEELDPNRSVPPLKALMADMYERWLLLSGSKSAYIAGQGVSVGLSPISQNQQLKRQVEGEAESALTPINKLRRMLKKE